MFVLACFKFSLLICQWLIGVATLRLYLALAEKDFFFNLLFIYLFSLFLLLFIALIALFGTIYEFHFIISTSFYFYL